MSEEASNELRPEGWSEEDIKWVNVVQPVVIRPVAVKYGRKVFALVWQAMSIGEALLQANLAMQTMAKWGMKKQIQQLNAALGIIHQTTNRTMMDATIFAGKTFEDFKACKDEIERVMTIAAGAPSQAAPGEKVSDGGIILQ